MTRPRKVPHPGWACCDLTQDLRGWLVLEYGRAEGLYALGREARAQAEAIPKAAAWEPSEGRRIALHGTANAHNQMAGMIRAHAARVEAAHQWRLT